jgi:rhodanese-related sulfurtransferase
MRKLLRLLPVLLISGLVYFSGCGNEDEPELDYPAFGILVEYLEANNLDLPTMLVDWIVDPPDLANVNDFINSYYILDIRGTAYYDAGHIEGAVSSDLLNVVEDAENADKTILLVDQTGQISGHAMVALRLSGYPNCKVLKWGMAGWNSDFAGPWINNVSDTAKTFMSWIAAPGDLAPGGETYKDPVIRTAETFPDSILEDQVDHLVDGFRNSLALNVLKYPPGYFINAYLDASVIETYGHLQGAYRIKPISIAGGEIYYLDPDKSINVYSNTGHISSVVAAYLVVLGYQAQTITYGANAMIYSDLEAEHKYTLPTEELPYETN